MSVCYIIILVGGTKIVSSQYLQKCKKYKKAEWTWIETESEDVMAWSV